MKKNRCKNLLLYLLVSMTLPVHAEDFDLLTQRDTLFEELPCGIGSIGSWLDSVQLDLVLNDTLQTCDSSNFRIITNDLSEDELLIENCQTKQFNIFIEDSCGIKDTLPVQLSTVDSEPPLLIGIPASNLFLSCSDPIPPLPIVTARDNCLDSATINANITLDSTFREFGSCYYEYSIEYRWTVTDGCNPPVSGSFFVNVQDFDANDPFFGAPTFTPPADITISCTDDAYNLAFTGLPTEITDNCDADIANRLPVYNDQIITGNCPGNYIIERTWTVEDTCGTVSLPITQIITVVDTFPPLFTPPGDTTLSNCGPLINLDLFGQPYDLSDNCSSAEQIATYVSHIDTIIGACSGAFTYVKNWVVEDACGNQAIHQQTISFLDNTPPSFITPPTDTIITCFYSEDIDSVFNQWVLNFAGAVADDNCSVKENLTWAAYIGNGSDPFLPSTECRVGSAIRMQIVNFSVTDECGNTSVSQASFSLVDEDPPVISNCPTDTVLNVENDACFALFGWPIPIIEEGCPDAIINSTLSQELPILTAEEATDSSSFGSVAPLSFALPAPDKNLIYHPYKTLILTVDLQNANIEDAKEYFSVLDENNQLIGITNHTPSPTMEPCQNSSTSFEIPLETFLNWIEDDSIFIQLIPNPPLDGIPGSDIDPICYGTSTATVHLSYATIEYSGLSLFYQLDEQNPIQILNLSVDSFFIEVYPGNHTLNLITLDCAGNSDTCTSNIWVEDTQKPAVFCPEPITIAIDSNSCHATLLPPLPSIVDNCIPDQDTNAYFSGYALQGATDLPFSLGIPSEEISFAVGVNTMTYYTEDASGYTDSCSFTISIQDIQSPKAICQNDTVFINPGFDQTYSLAVENIDAGSFDNCSLAGLFINTPEISCADYPKKDLYLIAEDEAGNRDSCAFVLTIEKVKPQVSFSITDCANGSLELIPGPPEGNFSFQWSGPNGFNSSSAFSVLTGVDESFEGLYKLTLYGFEGCFTEDSVFISAEELPFTPILSNIGTKCQGEPVILSTDGSKPQGDSIQYYWYENDRLLGVTDSSFLNYTVPEAGSNPELSVRVAKKNCLGPSSNPISLFINEAPSVQISPISDSYCFGATVQLQVSNPNSSFEYYWTGPEGFSATGSTVELQSIQSGWISLSANNGQCLSLPDSVFVEIIPAWPTPVIAPVDTLCSGDSLLLISPSVGPEATFSWTGPDNQFFETNTEELSIDNVTLAQQGLWTVTQHIDGCSTPMSSGVYVAVQPIPAVDLAWQDTIICMGSLLEFNFSTSSQATVINWTGPQGFSNSNPSFTFNEIQPNQSGEYALTLTDQLGCTVSSNLSVEVAEAPIIDEFILELPNCFGNGESGTIIPTITSSDPNLTYRWTNPNDITISETQNLLLDNLSSDDNGNYTLFVSNSIGCQSNAFTNLLVPDALPSPPELNLVATTVCEGESVQIGVEAPTGFSVEYLWTTPTGPITTTEPFLYFEEISLIDSGNYSVQFKDEGCFSASSVSTALAVISIPRLQASIEDVACEGQPFQLSATGPSQTQFNWQGPDFNANVANPTVNNGKSGAYILNGSIGGCIAIPDTLLIDLKPIPETPLLTSSGPVCLIDTIGFLQLSIDPSSTSDSTSYEWFLFEELISRTEDLDLILEEFSGYDPGVYGFSARADRNGCVSDFSNTVNITFSQAPDSRAFAGVDKEICSSSILTLDASPPATGTGRWSIVSGPDQEVVIVNPSLPKSDVTNLSPDTTYTFRWTLSDGFCQNYDFDEVEIKVTRQATVEAGDDILACESNSTQLSAIEVTTGIGSWVQNPLQELIGVRIVNPNDPQSTITGLEPGNQYKFTWVVASACGTSTDDVFVVVSDPNPNAGEDFILCSDDSAVELNAAEPTIGSSGQWSATDPSIVFSNPGFHQSNATGLKSGINTFIWTIDQGICGPSSRDTLIIDFTPSPIASDDIYEIPFQQEASLNILLNDSTFGEAIQLNIVQFPSGGNITIESDSTLLYAPNTLFVGSDRLIYEICVENCACAMAEITLQVGADAPCTVPTIFTPNGDGINDQLIITCLLDDTGYPDSQITIYNNWGDEVYRSPIPYQNDWDGTFKGKNLPVGTYYYILNFGSGGTPVAGFIVIQR